jgi:hypothetical protein
MQSDDPLVVDAVVTKYYYNKIINGHTYSYAEWRDADGKHHTKREDPPPGYLAAKSKLGKK